MALLRTQDRVAIDDGIPEHDDSFFGTCQTDTEARNELEARILDAQKGHIRSDDLLKILMGSQVFMPAQDEKAPVLNDQCSTRAQPLVLSAEDGTPILALFSSPERAKPFLEKFLGFTGGILELFKWVLQNMGSGYGIALNPESEVGFDMGPEIVQGQIQQLAAGETQH